MQRRKPTKQDIIDEFQRIHARDGVVSQTIFKRETGWDKYWFDKYWPIGGYSEACEEAGVTRGQIFGKEANLFVDEEQLAIRLADAVQAFGFKIPGIKRLRMLTHTSETTILRDGSYEDAKRRIIKAYFSLPVTERRSKAVEDALRAELKRLEGGKNVESAAPAATVGLGRQHSIQVPDNFIDDVRALREQGEEEQRQLVVRFFVEILGYRRLRVRSEHQKNDVCIYDRSKKPWLVVEVKASLKSDKEKRAARRQAFDYAHRKALRYVVISDGDFYEVYDRCAGERLSYDEMKQGSFQLTSLRSRDSDLLSLLASER